MQGKGWQGHALQGTGGEEEWGRQGVLDAGQAAPDPRFMGRLGRCGAGQQASVLCDSSQPTHWGIAWPLLPCAILSFSAALIVWPV